MDLLYDATGKYTRSTELPYKQRCLLLLAQCTPIRFYSLIFFEKKSVKIR